MKRALKTILEELYAIDPDLRAHEAELIPVVTLLLKHNPGMEPDQAFVQELRQRLQAHASSLSSHHSPSFFSFFTMDKLSYTFAGAALAVIIAVPVTYYSLSSGTTGGTPAPVFTYAVTPTSDKAFGSLNTLQPGAEGGRGGGGGGGPVAGESKLMAPDMAINPEITQFEYVYGGTLPPLTDATVSVLKRQGLTGPDITSIGKNFQVGAIDVQSFAGAKVDNISFTQDVDHGYTIYMQTANGAVNISQNWNRWPHPDAECRDDACYQRYRMSLTDLLADDTLIGIANDFIAAHGIDVSHYGEPEIDNQWKTDYENAADASMAYVPDVQQVLYPLIVDGKQVHDQGGMKTGIRVGVSAREKKVSDVSGIMSQQYLRSSYDGVTDANDINTYLASVDKMNYGIMAPNVKTKIVKVELGEPTVGYETYYRYDKGVNDEIIVPALIFPVTNVPKGEYLYRTFVIVPLAKELLTTQNNGPIMY